MNSSKSIKGVVFQLQGPFGHFLRAEASASALSYPVPPRTVLLGLMGAVLGLEKDTPQTVFQDARIAVQGRCPRTHWHRAKFRKEVPAPLDWTIKKNAKGSQTDEKATLIMQEWLIQPSYTVVAALPEPFHRELQDRLEQRRWHFTPSLGLSEMMADLQFLSTVELRPLEAEQDILSWSLCPQEGTEFLLQKAHPVQISVQRLPRAVTQDRIFSHANYLVEQQGKPIPIRTALAWEMQGWGEKREVMFM